MVVSVQKALCFLFSIGGIAAHASIFALIQTAMEFIAAIIKHILPVFAEPDGCLPVVTQLGFTQFVHGMNAHSPATIGISSAIITKLRSGVNRFIIPGIRLHRTIAAADRFPVISIRTIFFSASSSSSKLLLVYCCQTRYHYPGDRHYIVWFGIIGGDAIKLPNRNAGFIPVFAIIIKWYCSRRHCPVIQCRPCRVNPAGMPVGMRGIFIRYLKCFATVFTIDTIKAQHHHFIFVGGR